MYFNAVNFQLTLKIQKLPLVCQLMLYFLVWLLCVGSVSAETISNQAQIIYNAHNNPVPINATSGTLLTQISALPVPDITVTKNASTPIAVAGQDNVFDITYTIEIFNIGTVTAKNIHLADNLNCVFHPSTVTAWEVIQKPKVLTGSLLVNPSYTGDAACSTNTDVSNFDTTDTLQLVTGNKSLLPKESTKITFSVRITVAPTLNNIGLTFQNTVVAASLAGPNPISSVTVAAASAASISAKIRAAKPTGIVYNSLTRQPVSGAIVTLSRDPNSCTLGDITKNQLFNPFSTKYTPNTDGSMSMTTGKDGSYSFFLNTGTTCNYTLSITPPANSGLVSPSANFPSKSGIAPMGAVQAQAKIPTGKEVVYYLNLRLSSGSNVWYNHIPLDPENNTPRTLLFLNKESTKLVAEIGDIVPYTLKVNNSTGTTLDNIHINDVLPRGFRLLSGSVRFRSNADSSSGLWQTLPDPAGSPGAPLLFTVNGLQWPDKTTIELTYQLQIGVGAALDKNSVNIAYASSDDFTSNQSSWAITVTGGVFSDEAFLMGKVYLEDCKADKVQGKNEVGIPGVRLLMEDGTSVITDIEGKYSLYGLSPITHVLKLDATTLPKEAHLIALSNRNAGKGDSRFIDLKKGELHKADFAVDSCNADAVVNEVQLRREALEAQPVQDGQALIGQRFNAKYTENLVSDPKALPASGIITTTGPQALNTLNNGITANTKSTNSVYQTVAPANLIQSLAEQHLQAAAPHRPLVIPLETVVKNLDNSSEFIDLKDGDTLPVSVINIRVKGLLGSTLRLKVNGTEESLSHVGKKSTIADKHLEAWEYIGVTLRTGKNIALLEVVDAFGNVHSSKSITLIAPGQAGAIKIDTPANAIADSKTPVKITVHLVDDNGVPVTARTQLTLEISQGIWVTKDLDPEEPGLQAFMEDGQAEFTLLPPGAPIDAMLKISAGELQNQAKITFLPELRPLIGAGIIEGVVNFKAGKVNVNAPSANDAFERELRNISVNGADMRASGRAAFFFKGTIKGQYLLTTAYDSDKDTKQRLFRDIQPDRFYPIYGDSSIKGFDAQSTQRFYLRVDKEKSYALYGDFTTADNSIDRKLSQYSRSATGVKGHYENGKFSGTAWGSHDNLAQVIVTIPSNGTSGPYKTSEMDNMYENSEKVEVLVRNPDQPTLILETRQMSRFVDYSINLVTHEIFFKNPVGLSTANSSIQPIIRVTFESAQGGKAFFKGGADARIKLTDNVEIGASYIRNENPEQKTALMGSTAIVKLGEKTTLIGEVARTETGKYNPSAAVTGKNNIHFSNQSNVGTNAFNSFGSINESNTTMEGSGWAERIELRHEESNFKADAQITHADKNFNNPTSGFSPGRTEATANAKYKLDAQTNLIGQGIYSKDSINGGMRVGALASIEHAFNDVISAELGMRAVHQALAKTPQGTNIGSFSNIPLNTLIGAPNDLLTIRGKLVAKLPWIKGLDVSAEAEQDIFDIKKHMFAVGAGYLVNDKTRVYGRYELISSLNSPYALNATQQNNQAVIGIESAYSKDGRLFSEYRLKSAVNGREAQAAMGLRHTWAITEGLRVGGGFETTHAFAGQPGSDSTAITGLVEYTTDPRYKLTGSLESRFADSGNSWLNTVGLAYKINQDWSLLARNGLSVQENTTDDSELWRTRQQIGVAWRQVDNNRWNALGRYEHRLEEQIGGKDPYRERSHILSTHINYQPRRDLIASGRYAVQWTEQNGKTPNGKIAQANALTQLIYGRATWDFWKDFDLSVQSGVFKDDHAIQFSEGIELGYQVVNDLWASIGYNMQGFDGGDLKGTDYTAQGFYVRARFKFDEGLFN